MLAPAARGAWPAAPPPSACSTSAATSCPRSSATSPRRGIELLLAHPGAFRAQLAAIAGAGGRAELRLLLPLVRGAEDVPARRGAMLRRRRPPLSVGAMIELPEAAEAAREIAARVRLPQRRDERPHARHARHRPLRARRGARARPARAAEHRARRGRRAGGGDPARGVRRGRLRPADRAAAGRARRRRAERRRGARGHRCARGSAHSTTTGTRELAHGRRSTPPTPSRRAAGPAARAESAEGRDALAHRGEGRVRVFAGRGQAQLRPALRSQGEHRQQALRVGLALA